MYKLLIIAALLITFFQNGNNKSNPEKNIQKTKPLPFVTGSIVKLDGGCSYYVNSTIPVNNYGSDKSQLVIAAKQLAFIEYEKDKYAFFLRTKRVTNKTGYTDYYKGKQGSFILKIDSIAKHSAYFTFRSGKLILSFPGLSQTIKVHGIVDEEDSYRKKFFPHS